MSLAECQTPTPFRGKPTSLCMTAFRLDEVLDFFNATKSAFIWGVPYPTTDASKWNSTNPRALLSYLAAKGYTPLGLELGEEMAPSPLDAGTDGRGSESEYTALVEAYSELHAIVKQLWPLNPPVVLGPSVGMSEVASNKFITHFIKDTIAAGSLQAVNMHR